MESKSRQIRFGLWGFLLGSLLPLAWMLYQLIALKSQHHLLHADQASSLALGSFLVVVGLSATLIGALAGTLLGVALAWMTVSLRRGPPDGT